MMVTYFVNRKTCMRGDYAQQLIDQHCFKGKVWLIKDKYREVFKICLNLSSIILLIFLSGDIVQKLPVRIYVATINLCLLFIEILVHLWEIFKIKIIYKDAKTNWSKFETLLLALSLPGTFLLVVPIIKFGIGL